MGNLVAVIGDIHGCADQLQQLITQIHTSFGGIPLYHVGDLIDRGTNPSGVLDLCIRENIQGTLGNHELWFIQMTQTGKMLEWVREPIMGGDPTFRSYRVDPGSPRAGEMLKQVVPEAHREYLLGLHAYLPLGKYVLLHTGLAEKVWAGIDFRPSNELDFLEALVEHKPDLYFWHGCRPFEPAGVHAFKDYCQVFGHTPLRQVMVKPHYIALDTGAGTCPPRRLSAVVLDTEAGGAPLAILSV